MRISDWSSDVCSSDLDRAPIDEITPEGWDRTMDLVLKSVAMGIRYAAPHMKGRKGASIVNTASVAALGAGYSPIAYAVAKAGVLHLSKVAATDLAQYGKIGRAHV